MPPLPLELPQGQRQNPNAVSAYNKCLLREAKIESSTEKTTGEKAKALIYVRVLGYLLHHIPSEIGLVNITGEILSCLEEDAILDLGLHYFNHYIRAFRANKGRTPTPSNHPSRPSFDTKVDMINDTLENAPQSHSTAKRKALYRDGYRCVVTGQYDLPSLRTIKELGDEFKSAPSSGIVYTQCAHIFSESTNADIEPGSDKRVYASVFWTLLQQFGYTTLPDDLNGSNIHRLENVMTLNHTVHRSFDDLNLWFVKQEDKDNTYMLEGADLPFLQDLPKYVTFTTPDPVNFPLPSPTYLAIHAACAKVAHLSGASEYIDKFYRDMEDRTTLEADGSSVDMLEHALYGLYVRGY